MRRRMLLHALGSWLSGEIHCCFELLYPQVDEALLRTIIFRKLSPVWLKMRKLMCKPLYKNAILGVL